MNAENYLKFTKLAGCLLSPAYGFVSCVEQNEKCINFV